MVRMRLYGRQRHESSLCLVAGTVLAWVNVEFGYVENQDMITAVGTCSLNHEGLCLGRCKTEGPEWMCPS